jgi:hypothetical protein
MEARMAIYIRRVQTVLTEEQFGLLTQLARKRHQPISNLVREAIERIYFSDVGGLKQRRTALQDLLSLQAPVSDWKRIEADIIRGATAE